MKSIIWIINVHYWKSITGPFFSFVFPIIFLAILGTLLGYDQILGSIISIPSTTIALTVLPAAIFEFKNSSLLKRIGVTSIKPWLFILTISVFYILIMLISTVITILMSFVVFIDYIKIGKTFGDLTLPSLTKVFENVNFLCLIWAIFINIFIGTSFGLMISSLSKSIMEVQGIGIPILILAMFLAGQALPISIIRDIKGIYLTSYILPFKYSTGLIIESWNGNFALSPESGITISMSNIFDINKDFFCLGMYKIEPLKIFGKIDKILNLVLPFVFISIFSYVSIKTFKWSIK